MKRRDFVRTTIGASLFAAAPRVVHGQAPAVGTPKSRRPVVIASANGNQYKNGGDETCVQKAFRLMTEGADVLEALIAGVTILELDPADTSVGFGGLPNADGVVQLDACCMHGPAKRAGGVAALEGVRTPAAVAHKVLQHTDHHLLVGRGAQLFARNFGFKIEDDLNSEESRRQWLEWKQKTDPERYLDPQKRAAAGDRAREEMIAEGRLDAEKVWGTVNCNGINAKGDICGVTTTSGLAWKIPGRVGDSPILGAGLYVDGEIGAAGSTGRGEANLFGLSSFLIVEEMRRGMNPKDACLEALRRIRSRTIEKRLLNSRGTPNFNVQFYALNAKGEFAGVSLYSERERADRKGFEPVEFAACTEEGPRTLKCDALIDGHARD